MSDDRFKNVPRAEGLVGKPMQASGADCWEACAGEPKRSNPIMKFFAFEHLRDPELKEVSRSCAALARAMDEQLPDGAEKSAGLRKLLEAKDCFVRAKLP